MIPHRVLRKHLLFALPLLAFCLFSGTALVASPDAVLLTTDTQGHIDPCSHCPGQEEQGGIGQRAGLLKNLRTKHENALLFDAGNFLFGGHIPLDNSRFMVESYSKLNYAAVNVSYRDFRQGKKKTIKLLKEATFTPLSSNLVHEQSDEPIFQPHEIYKKGDEKIGVIGVTDVSFNRNETPSLDEQLRGISVRDPIPSVKSSVSALEGKVDHILVLYYGSTDTLIHLHKKFSEQVDYFLSGGLRLSNEDARSGTVPLLTAPRYGTGIGLLPISSSGKSLTSKNPRTISVESETTPTSDVQKLVSAHKEKVKPATSKIEREKEELPEDPELNRTYKIWKTGRNRGIRITVRSMTFRDSVGQATSPSGERFAVLDTNWENRVGIKLVDAGIPRQVGILGVSKRTFLTINGHRLARVHEYQKKLAGGIPSSFVLKKPGSLGSGKLLFQVPSKGVNSMTLYMFHDRYGSLRVPLMEGDTSENGPGQTEAKQWKQNNLFKLGYFDHRTKATYRGKTAPDGMEFLLVDLGGRSRLSLKTEAIAIREDVKGKKKKMVSMKKPIPHAYAYTMFQAVVDGERTYLPNWEAGTFPDVPVFLPDYTIRGTVVYLVPKKRDSLSVHVHFPTLKIPGRRGEKKMVDSLKSVHFDLEGTYSKPGGGKAVGVLKDKPITVEIMSTNVKKSFLGENAENGKRFLVLRVKLKYLNNDQGGMYSPKERMYLKVGGSDQTSLHPVSFKVGNPPSEKFFVPSGTPQSFDLVYEIPQETREATINYQGINRNPRLKINIPEEEK